jgi:hypothetical protein
MAAETEAFPGKDDAVVAPKRKPGRPAKKRHDPAPAPIDGDYSLDQVVNKQAGFDYGLVSKRQRARYQARGWTPERWGPNCARSKWDYGEHVNGDEILINNELTLMKIPADLRNEIARAERRPHDAAKAALKQAAVDSGGKFKQFAGIQF